MTQARVFQSDCEAVRARGASAFGGEAVWPDEYRLVARVSAPDGADPQDVAELAFSLTQHLDKAWWANAGVERVGPETRSTSVGDVILVGDEGFFCDRFGWKRFSVARPALTGSF
jgi:hypothetical protein